MSNFDGVNLDEVQNNPSNETDEDPAQEVCQCRFDGSALEALEEKILGLQDLFVRRLNEDKQKASLIKTLEDGASFAFIEPFISDIILLLDRLDKSDDDFVQSVKEELLGIIERRGVKKIEVTGKFDPAVNKAIKVIADPEVREMSITGIIRNGYIFSGKVIRPAEVIVARPVEADIAEGE